MKVRGQKKEVATFLEAKLLQCYEDAIEILQKLFGDSSALIQDHMQGLIDINPKREKWCCAFCRRRCLDESQQPPLSHLLGFIEIELESRERTFEDRPDDASGQPPSRFIAKTRPRGNGHVLSAASIAWSAI
ncbi:hypothetical protein HPB50_014761 [Hyalomma asiaticum]|uniref:Uncharacterized protein n=1 Tax=Hyalomma asiaticum TaxID=266040 RepID=A0ACB7TKG8_HYAAI|nr:hypothetical protein HPB50_014761 [Hyalomma asiaticum]